VHWRLGEQSVEVRTGHWPAEEVALVVIAAVAGEEVALGFGFHAFGDHLQAQGLTHAADGFDDGGQTRV